MVSTAALVLAGAPGQAYGQGPRLLLDGAELDLRASFPVIEASGFPEQPAVILIQLRETPREALLASLRDQGLEPAAYLPEDAFLALGTPAAAARARLLGFVHWAGSLPPTLKVAPALRELPVKGGPREVIIQLLDAGDLQPLRKFLRQAGASEISLAVYGPRLHLRAWLPPELIAPLSRWPGVFRIEPFPELHLHGERSIMAALGTAPLEATCVEPGYEGFLERKGARGEALVMHVMDDGIEQGDASGLVGTAHPDLLGAIAGVDNATSDAEADCRAGHGSFNACLLVGRAATGVTDEAGFLLGQGVLPAATVFATKIFNNAGRFEIGPRTFADLVGEAARRGALISSNSWGASTFGQYDALCAEFDFLARDASGEDGEQPMTFVFAAGNEGDDVEGGAQSIGSPAAAKNVISVGASEGCGADGRDGCGTPVEDGDSIRDVPRFSSRGPLADGRVGPMLVAPGSHVAGIAAAAVGYDGSGLCDPFYPPGQVLYARGTGTSHACPLVAGAAALFHQRLLSRTGESPSPALIRAALAATADDLAGGHDGFGGVLASVPNDAQGWGRLAMDALVPDRNGVARALYFDQQTTLTDTGDAWELTVFPAAAGQPVRISLAWDDPAALPGAGATLVNDLDLEAEAGQLYLGNRLEDGISLPGGEPDRLHNLECVFLGTPPPVIRLRVRAARIAADGAAHGDDTDQDFALVIQGGTLQSSRGVISLKRSEYACDGIVAAVVSDLDLKGRSSVDVTIASSAAEQPVALRLTEVSAGAGIFDGTVFLGKNPGQLFVQDGGTITGRYVDENDGSGARSEMTATATVDCSPPVVSGVSVEDISDTGATVIWTTDEEASGKLLHGSLCAQLQTERLAPRRLREQRVSLAGLAPGARQLFTITASDSVGNTSVADHAGTCFSFFTSGLICGFQDDIEPEPAAGWTHRAVQGPDDWKPVVFRGAHSPTRAWGATAFDGFKDSWLVTPPLELAAGDRFTFWHTYQLEKGYDGAVLEISTDGGANWVDLGPNLVRGGYSEVVSGNPLGDRLAWTGQQSETMTAVEADLTPWAGPARLIRFRLASDSSFADGFGWYIDDIAVCRSLNKRGRIALDRTVYRCGDTATIRVDDLDLVGAETAAVTLSSTSHPAPMPFPLAEVGVRSGILVARVPLGDQPGGFPAVHGDAITVAYVDQDDGSFDAPATVTAAGAVDCVGPVIAGVRLVELLDDEATIRWETDEPTLGRIALGPTCETAVALHDSPLGGTRHEVRLQGLTASQPLHFKVIAEDEAGNSTVDDAAGRCRSFRLPGRKAESFDFDDGAPGWAHQAAMGPDGWSLESQTFAQSPPNAWMLPGADTFSDASLVSPLFLIPPRGYLSFWHTYELEAGFDGAVVEISADGGATWLDLGPSIRRGGYNTVLQPPNPLAGRRAWSGGELGPMTRVLIDLERWQGALVQVRFRAASDSSVGGDGWVIDRVEVGQSIREDASLALDHEAYACVSQLAVEVLDTGLIGEGAAQVEVTAGGRLPALVVSLPEREPRTGAFAGTIELAGAALPGALRVEPGDAIRVLYRDLARAAGEPVELEATARVDCSPPVIADVAAAETIDGTTLISWRTSEKTTGRVDLGEACGSWSLQLVAATPAESHSVMVPGLPDGTRHTFRILATDAAGNESVDDAAGACHSFHTGVRFCVLESSLEDAPGPGWDEGARFRVEEHPLAHSGKRVWRIAGDGRRSDVTLTLPPLRVGPGAVLELWHSYELASGLAGALLEGSSDGGETWRDLGEEILEGRYTAYLQPGGPVEGRRAWTGGKLDAPTRVQVSLDSLGDGEILLRLRWVSQGIGTEGEWLIDDISVCQRAGEAGQTAFASIAYSCGASGTVLLADADLAGTGTARLELTSARQPQPLLLEATESSPGFFTSSFALSAEPSEGKLVAAHGDALAVTYRDASDARGVPAVAQAAATVDCVAPTLRSVRFGRAGFSSLQLLWETDEPARGRVRFGSSCEQLERTASVGSLRTAQLVTLSGLTAGQPVQLRVEAIDLAGNIATTTRCIDASVVQQCPLDDRLEPPLPGWTHAAAVGPDDWSVVDFDGARSATRAFHGPNSGLLKDASLVTPPVDIGPGALLSFWHTFELEEGFDGARLEASTDGGQSWRDLGGDILTGKYNGTITGPGGSMVGWTGGTIDEMTRVTVSLDRYAGDGLRIRFRLLCDQSVGTPGWFIDDVSICTFEADTTGSRFTRGNCNGDLEVNISDPVYLLTFLFLGGPEPRCTDACDADGSVLLNLTDAVYLLNHLFRGGSPIPEPTTCGFALDSQLDCANDACGQ